MIKVSFLTTYVNQESYCRPILDKSVSFVCTIKPGGTYGDSWEISPLTFGRYIIPIVIREYRLQLPHLIWKCSAGPEYEKSSTPLMFYDTSDVILGVR